MNFSEYLKTIIKKNKGLSGQSLLKHRKIYLEWASQIESKKTPMDLELPWITIIAKNYIVDFLKNKSKSDVNVFPSWPALTPAPASARRSPSPAAPPYARPASKSRWRFASMQPMLPAAITSGFRRAMLATLRSRSAPRFRAARCCRCRPSRSRCAPSGGLAHLEAGAAQQRLRRLEDLLAVLQRAGGVIGDDELSHGLRTRGRARRDIR